jgi:hypothetical protein
MKSFLLVYSRKSGKLLEQREYDERARPEALKDRLDLELHHRGNPDIEVIVLNAESHEALLQTHARYFKTLKELGQDLGIAAKDPRPA